MMPEHYEDAARLLKMLTTSGLAIKSGVPPHGIILLIIAQCFGAAAKRMSQYERAYALLAELERINAVQCGENRKKLVAMVGTSIANHQIARRKRPQH